MVLTLMQRLRKEYREKGPPATRLELEERYPFDDPLALGEDELDDWGDEDDWALERKHDAERDARAERELQHARGSKSPGLVRGFVPDKLSTMGPTGVVSTKLVDLLKIRPRPARAGFFTDAISNVMDLGPDIRRAPYLPPIRRIRVTPVNDLAKTLVVKNTDIPSRKFYTIHRTASTKHFENPDTVVALDNNGEIYKYKVVFELKDGTSRPMTRELFEEEVRHRAAFNKEVGFFAVTVTGEVLDVLAGAVQRATEEALGLTDVYLADILSAMAEKYTAFGDLVSKLGHVCAVAVLFPTRSFARKLKYEVLTPMAVASVTVDSMLEDVTVTADLTKRVFAQSEVFAAEFADVVMRVQNPTVRAKTRPTAFHQRPVVDFVPQRCTTPSGSAPPDSLDIVFVDGQCYDLRLLMEAYISDLPNPYTGEPFTDSMKSVLANYRREKYEDVQSVLALSLSSEDVPVDREAGKTRARLYDHIVRWLDGEVEDAVSQPDFKTLVCAYCKRTFGDLNPIKSVRKNKLVLFCDEKCMDDSPWE